MAGLLTKVGMGAALAATALTTAAPAEAQRWRGYRGHRGGDTAAAAILGGVVGLGARRSRRAIADAITIAVTITTKAMRRAIATGRAAITRRRRPRRGWCTAVTTAIPITTAAITGRADTTAGNGRG